MGIKIKGKEYISADEIAKLVGIARDNIYYLIRERDVHAHAQDGVRYFCKKEILVAFERMKNIYISSKAVNIMLKNAGLVHLIELNEDEPFDFDNFDNDVNFPNPTALQRDYEHGGYDYIPLWRIGDLIEWKKNIQNN